MNVQETEMLMSPAQINSTQNLNIPVPVTRVTVNQPTMSMQKASHSFSFHKPSQSSNKFGGIPRKSNKDKSAQSKSKKSNHAHGRKQETNNTSTTSAYKESPCLPKREPT